VVTSLFNVLLSHYLLEEQPQVHSQNARMERERESLRYYYAIIVIFCFTTVLEVASWSTFEELAAGTGIGRQKGTCVFFAQGILFDGPRSSTLVL
jgi:hypothetical protein